jgi:hypothetical protein
VMRSDIGRVQQFENSAIWSRACAHAGVDDASEAGRLALDEVTGYTSPMATVTEQLRKAVETSGQSRYAISKATGVPESVLSRFVAGGGGLRSESIDVLCAYFGLRLCGGKKTGSKAGKGR